MSRVSILGAGGWGIALSVLLNHNQHQVSLWEFDKDDFQMLSKKRERKDKLPKVKIPQSVKITNELKEALSNQEYICLALPSHTVRGVAKKIAPLLYGNPIVINLAKGIENKTLCRMSEVLVGELPKKIRPNITTLSGPSHAEEVSRKVPTTVVVAGFNDKTTEKVQKLFMNEFFRVYTHHDLIGVELGGSLKNIIAIASGICDGLGLGDNTKGALISRGLAEMIRLGEKLGADAKTFAGLSGVGDLITTCFSKYSRNRYVGEEIGKGRKLKDVLSKMSMVAEGVKTTRSAYRLSRKHKVEMPITHKVYQVLFEDKPPKLGLMELMTRQPKSEIWN
ncbi:MAG TPA: NAD(P)H-dependent glycerol-3-phosphate dehydrogenase [candidate division Zixibacteria bacterium]